MAELGIDWVMTAFFIAGVYIETERTVAKLSGKSTRDAVLKGLVLCLLGLLIGAASYQVFGG